MPVDSKKVTTACEGACQAFSRTSLTFHVDVTSSTSPWDTRPSGLQKAEVLKMLNDEFQASMETDSCATGCVCNTGGGSSLYASYALSGQVTVHPSEGGSIDANIELSYTTSAAPGDCAFPG